MTAIADSLVIRPIRFGGTNRLCLEMTCTEHPGFGVSFSSMPDPAVSFRQILEEVRLHLLAAHNKKGLKMNRAERTAAQIAHLEEHKAIFQDDKGPDVAEYMHDYGHIWDLYQRVCEDLGIEVRPEICHPNPED